MSNITIWSIDRTVSGAALAMKGYIIFPTTPRLESHHHVWVGGSSLQRFSPCILQSQPTMLYRKWFNEYRLAGAVLLVDHSGVKVWILAVLYKSTCCFEEIFRLKILICTPQFTFFFFSFFFFLTEIFFFQYRVIPYFPLSSRLGLQNTPTALLQRSKTSRQRVS